jgi:hypothetical protein
MGATSDSRPRPLVGRSGQRAFAQLVEEQVGVKVVHGIGVKTEPLINSL